MFKLVKAGKVMTTFNQMLTMEGQGVSELITILQGCIVHEKVEGKIHDPDQDKTEQRSYIDELKRGELWINSFKLNNSKRTEALLPNHPIENMTFILEYF